MAATMVTWYYRYRQWVNCQGGGYLEDYNLPGGTGQVPTLPSVALLQTVNWIVQLRGQLLEGNSKIANGEISVETVPGSNPAEGFQLPHNIPNSYPILLNDPTSNVVETQIGVANDPEQAIAYRLDAGSGNTELRTLRSLRASWVLQKAILLPNVAFWLSNLGAAPPPVITDPAIPPTYPAGINNPAGMIAYFMLLVKQATVFTQYQKSGGSFFQMAQSAWKPANSSGSPMVVNPILSPDLTRRKVGEGWPKTHGKMQTFGTHG